VHERYTSLMSLVLDGVASSREQQELCQHLDVCSACVETWHRWQAVDRMLLRAAVAEPSRSMADQIAQRFHQYRRHQSPMAWLAPGLLIGWVLCLGASCLAILGLLWLGWRHPLEVAIILSSGAQALSKATWVLANLETIVASAHLPGLPVIFLAWALCGTGLLLLGTYAVLHSVSARRSERSLATER
jgi:anti-sigma factor RsiW